MARGVDIGFLLWNCHIFFFTFKEKIILIILNVEKGFLSRVLQKILCIRNLLYAMLLMYCTRTDTDTDTDTYITGYVGGWSILWWRITWPGSARGGGFTPYDRHFDEWTSETSQNGLSAHFADISESSFDILYIPFSTQSSKKAPPDQNLQFAKPPYIHTLLLSSPLQSLKNCGNTKQQKTSQPQTLSANSMSRHHP